MDIQYRFATLADLPFLVESRLRFIDATPQNVAYPLLCQRTSQYFDQALKERQCDVCLAENPDGIIGTGVVFYYASVPSQFNPWGQNAYITSMFVRESHRRRGIGRQILNRLMQQARQRGYHVFILQESDMGRPLYQQAGFVKGKPGMIFRDDLTEK